jgi:hypothetical protein
MRSISILVICLPLLFSLQVMANAAPPGFWGAGHGSTLIPVFRNEQEAIGKIQMQKEEIRIDLYRNYAVVKGSYWFYNHADKIVRVHTGYPVNGEHEAQVVDYVRFDDLHELRVLVEGKAVVSKPLDEWLLSESNERIPDERLNARNWYVWEMNLLPGELTRVDVYFIVKTDAVLTKGYGRKEANAFEYILHTGAAWKDSIQEGVITVRLQDGLTLDDLRGVLPMARVQTDGNKLYYTFTSLRPSVSDDLVIWYEGNKKPYDGSFPADEWYRKVDLLEITPKAGVRLSWLNKSDFDTPVPEFIYVLGGILLLGFVFLALLIASIVWLVKRLRRR